MTVPLPLKEERFFSVIICQDFTTITLHKQAAYDFKPQAFWRTRKPFTEALLNQNPTQVLGHFLCQTARQFVFGSQNEATVELALEEARRRQCHFLSVYILIWNQAQQAEANLVAWLFSELPARIIMVKDDQVRAPMTLYLRGIAGIHENPKSLLLIVAEASRINSYAFDKNGQIKERQEMLGLSVKCRRLMAEESNDSLYNSMKDWFHEKKGIDFFSKDENNARIMVLLQEVNLSLRHFISSFLSHNETDALNATIIVTGQDGNLLSELLSNNSLSPYGPSDPTLRPYTIKNQSDLLPCGVARTLLQQMDEKTAEINEALGLRIAKEFCQGNCMEAYRGTVLNIRRSDQGVLYMVRYDDNDQEDLTVIELHAALLFYSYVGEPFRHPRTDEVLQAIKEKRELSEKYARYLEGQLEGVKLMKHSNLRKNASGIKTCLEKMWMQERSVKHPPAGAGADAAVNTAAEHAAVLHDEDSTTTALDEKDQPLDSKSFLEHRIAKIFSGNLYFGKVASYDEEERLFRIIYDDDDTEEFDDRDMRKALRLYNEHKKKDPTITVSIGEVEVAGEELESYSELDEKDQPLDPKFFLEHRIAKVFSGNLYFGKVASYDEEERLFRIIYDDDDTEEFDDRDMRKALRLYNKHKKKDPTIIVSTEEVEVAAEELESDAEL